MSQLLFTPFYPLTAIATTPLAAQILQPLKQSMGATLLLPESVQPLENSQIYTGALKDHLASIWQENRAFIFCMATGAVVRLIAPLLKDKSHDPAVVVIDSQGHFVISLCGGHQGGADQLARLIAHQLGATPVLTGASASLGLPGIDVLGLPFGWRRGSGDWTGVSAALAAGKVVQVIQEAGSTLWQDHLPDGHPFYFGSAEEKEPLSPKARIWISARQRRSAPNQKSKVKSQKGECGERSDIPYTYPTPEEVQWHPRVLWVGIGCIRGTSRQLIATAIEQVCQRYHLATDAIAGLATIDIKADEVGLLEFCHQRQFPLKTFPAAVLREIKVPTPSDIVEQEVGTPSVAEASALLASQSTSFPFPLSPFPLSLLVPKQVIKSEDGKEAVTIAIAQSQLEYTGRSGQLYLVGIGPGDLAQITPAAKTAITQADVIIGYSLYIDLIQPLQRPGQIVEALPITQERQRAQRAIDLAEWGLSVAVISSGDCGIYGMAGLVFEELQERAWDGKTPQVEVFPGITALQSAAARVGAPLMHDFCAISLSDLLTPWEVIEKRLEAAAVGDFVTAIYNPRSQTRSQQIIIAQEIFLKYRDTSTPVAIVHSAYRQDEQITLTTLEKMLQFPIDMLTTVIIGNLSTRFYENWLITPRGYFKGNLRQLRQ